MSDRNNITNVKKYNKNRIFSLIYYSHGISRQEIAETLGLSLPTVNQNLRMLVDENLIEFEGNFESTGGRKPQVIRSNKYAKYVFGANITSEYVRTMLMDFNGNIMDVIQESHLPEEYKMAGSVIQKQIISLGKKNNLSAEDVLGVGITIPGVFNTTQTEILTVPTMNLKNIPVINITEQISIPVKVLNDARAAAFSDYWYSNMSELESDRYKEAVYLMLNDGVGGAYIRNGRIVQGMHNRCGESGHITIYPNGKKCMCGKNGCFESYVSQRVLSDNLGISLDEFFDRLRNRDEEISEIFEKYLNDLTIGINNLYIMNDSNIIIGGPVANYLRPYEKKLKQLFKNTCPFNADENNIMFSICDSYQAGAGAGLMHIAEFIESI